MIAELLYCIYNNDDKEVKLEEKEEENCNDDTFLSFQNHYFPSVYLARKSASMSLWHGYPFFINLKSIMRPVARIKGDLSIIFGFWVCDGHSVVRHCNNVLRHEGNLFLQPKTGAGLKARHP